MIRSVGIVGAAYIGGARVLHHLRLTLYLYVVQLGRSTGNKPDSVNAGTASAAYRCHTHTGSAAKGIRAKQIPLTCVLLLVHIKRGNKIFTVIYLHRCSGTPARPTGPPEKDIIGPRKSGLKRIGRTSIFAVQRIRTIRFRSS